MAQREVHLGQDQAVARALEGREAPLGRTRTARRAHEVDRARPLPSPHAPAQLVQGGEAKAVGVPDHHHGCVGHVHAHLDHRGRDEHLRHARAEVRHGLVLLGGRHAAGHDAHGELGKHAVAQALEGGLGRVGPRRGLLALGDVVELGAVVGVVHEWAHHVGLVSRGHGVCDGGVRHVGVLGSECLGGDARTGMRPLGDARAGQVAVDRERKRARDGRRRHGELVGCAALGAKRRALAHAEAVLLVHDHEREVQEADVVAEHRRGAEENAGLARRKRGGRLGALGRRRRARHERPADSCPVEEGSELLGVLAREH